MFLVPNPYSHLSQVREDLMKYLHHALVTIEQGLSYLTLSERPV